jgi:hypothetical protein
MVNLGGEVDLETDISTVAIIRDKNRYYLWRFEGVISREMDRQEKNTALIGTILLFYYYNNKMNIQITRTSFLILTGPIIVACQWKKSSPIGPAEQEEGGSRSRSLSSFWSKLECNGLD